MEQERGRDALAWSEIHAHALGGGAGGRTVHVHWPALHDAHTRFHLTSEEFDEVGAEIVRALQFYKVPEAETKLLVDAYMLSKPDVVASE